jgi:CRP-like cAMP-binding protein
MTNVNRSVKMSNRDRNILVRAPFIGTGDEASAMKLMDIATVITFDARNLLFREGDTAEHLFCVLSGYVRLYRLNKDGREADIRICGPAETFNECLIFGSEQYRYNAQTAENATLARFELSKIRSMVEQEASVAKAVMQCLSNSLLNTMDCVANDRLQTAPQRVANYLINSSPAEATSFSIRLPFQKSLLAGKLGLAPEALSRAFSSLRQAGVTVRGRVVQVNDLSALKQI